MIRRQTKPDQEELWIARKDLPRAQATRFYDKLEETLEGLDFAENVHGLCEAHYTSTKMGRPPIDPVVYFKMLMVGFLENLPSERAIATRCGDSLMVRRFLSYDLNQETPDHSSLSVIRKRLSLEVYQAVFDLILEGLQKHRLLRGKNLGIDSSVMEANASLRGLENRNTGEAYWEYVKSLAAQAGVDANDVDKVRRFDKNRPGRKTSNEEWVNPNDPDAKVGKAKDGATDMLYKPEHVVDLDTGTILNVEVRKADEADTEGLAERVVEAQALVEAIREEGEKPTPSEVASLTGDKGYYSVAELEAIQQEGIRTIISDPIGNRRLDKLEPEQREAVQRARHSARSKSGKALLRRRGMHIERSFAHILDSGGMRRATLCGSLNLNKRYKIAAAAYNLSQLMRHLVGIGTPKQAAAAVKRSFVALFGVLQMVLQAPQRAFLSFRAVFQSNSNFFARIFSIRNPFNDLVEKLTISTGC
jgi:transposase